MVENPRLVIASIDMPIGAGPDELSPCNLPCDHISAKASPPIPLDVGSTTVNAAAAATAASMALPPCCRVDNPACAAYGCDVATMPRCAYTGVRGSLYGFDNGSNDNIPNSSSSFFIEDEKKSEAKSC
jgi:hypothetical protein